MKKYLYAGGICFVLTLCLCLMLGLSGCNRVEVYQVPVYASGGNATDGNAYATDRNATDGNAARGEPVFEMAESTPTPMPAPDPTTTPAAVETTVPPAEAKPTPTPQPTGEPVEMPFSVTPEPTVPSAVEGVWLASEYTGAGEYNGLSAILTGLCDNYTLRSDASLGAKYAAQLMDWFAETGHSRDAVYAGVAGWLDRMGVLPDKRDSYYDSVELTARLDRLYSAAVSLTGREGEALLDAGSYVPAGFPYSMPDIDRVFSLVYSAVGEIKPQYIRCYRDGELSDILTADSGTLTPETLVKALTAANVLSPEVQVLRWQETDGILTVDLTDALLTQLEELEREGEERLLRSLAETVCENLGCGRVLFTVEGEPLKTAHGRYDVPFTP